MLTVSNIANRVKSWCDDHKMVNSFTFGPLLNMAETKDYELPLVHLFYKGTMMNERTKDMEFSVYCLSKTAIDATTTEQYETVSDMEMLLNDLVSEMKNPRGTPYGGLLAQPQATNLDTLGNDYKGDNSGRLYTDRSFSVGDVRVSPMIDQNTKLLCGVVADMTIEVSNPYDTCYIPY